VGTNDLQVLPPELLAAAAQWEGLSTQLVRVPPSPGQPFQPTTAAVTSVNAAIGVEAAALAARTQSTTAGVTTAAGGYVSQEAIAEGEMTALTQVRMV
jgi:hypothetical protein